MTEDTDAVTSTFIPELVAVRLKADIVTSGQEEMWGNRTVWLSTYLEASRFELDLTRLPQTPGGDASPPPS